MKICGPKCSLCGLILSVWGIIQLTLMGVFFYIRSVALLEDIGLPEEIEKIFDNDIEKVYKRADELYEQNALNCWIAAGFYVLLLAFSGHQMYSNIRSKA
ncbi:ribonuclease kappa-B-like [Condylostylus longicornis]|uniref:ribonuclease kappa-B-like n=1 Tax=Condylostylus longicornis TaxID=2530218 RepID=UPI00244DBDA7|nr:ribonuclease kappa-B-like [Condylostylus longicornis]